MAPRNQSVSATGAEIKKRCREELSALDDVIDYAERMIFEEDVRHPYVLLRRQAYAKTVLIYTEHRGVQAFRLSSTPAVITPNQINYATPHSPVGRLCSFLKAGDTGSSVAWGEYRVIESRLFERFDGPEFERNVRNFLRMKLSSGSVTHEVIDLRQVIAQPPDEEIGLVEPSSGSPVTVPEVVPDAAPAPGLSITRFAEVEEDNEALPADLEGDDEEAGADEALPVNYYGLNETFYVNRTRVQDQVIARSPIGPMFVEGIAGSGKTAAALGRTKMLCDFDARNVSSPEEFEAIVGDKGAYWDARFAGQFSQESSVGFVRTGELIQYLKETCRRLDLPNLPVLEFSELRARLRNHRQGTGVRRWKGALQQRVSTVETTMEWLRAADHAIAGKLAERLQTALPNPDEVAAGFDAGVREKALVVARQALKHCTVRLAGVTDSLTAGGGVFRLEGLGVRLTDVITQVREEVLGANVLWAVISGEFLHAGTERELALRVFNLRPALYTASERRLVWIDQHGVVDQGLTLIDGDGQIQPWSAEVPGRMARDEILVRDEDGNKYAATATDVDRLYAALLPESMVRLFVADGDRLRRLRTQRGLGRVKMPVLGKPQRGAGIEGPDAGTAPEHPFRSAGSKSRSVAAVLADMLRTRLLGNLSELALLYGEVLRDRPDSFPDPATAREIGAGLVAGNMTEADVDLVLCLYELVGRGLLRGAPAALVEPVAFQSVFIDEVQDFSEQQVFLMAAQANGRYRAVTVVGDLAQKLHSGDSIDIRACFPGQSLEYVRLEENLRQAEAPDLALYSACFRYVLQDGQKIPVSVVSQIRRESSSSPRLAMVEWDTEMALDQHILEELESVEAGRTAAVIFPDLEAATAVHSRVRQALAAKMISSEVSHKVDLARRFVAHFTSVENVKGLEFDVVIVSSVETYDTGRTLDRNRLYVAITRARRRMLILTRTGGSDRGLERVQALFSRLLA